MENPKITFLKIRRSVGNAHRATVDGITTHCGYVANRHFGIPSRRGVNEACDAWARRRKLVWVAAVGDYLPNAAAAAAIDALGANHLFS